MRKHLHVLVGVLGVMAVAAALTASAFVFADAEGTSAVAEDATVQARAADVVGAATVSRALLSEALILALAAEDGGVDPETVQDVVDQANSALAETEARVAELGEALGDDARPLELASADYLDESRAFLAAVVRGEPASAAEIHTPRVEESYDRLNGIASRERDEREQHIAAVRAGVGEVAQAARFLVAFAIPAVTIIGVLAMFRRRQLRIREEEEARRQRELRRARDEFLTAVAHELRTPLTAVVGFAEMLREDSRTITPTEREEMVEVLADQAINSAAMVENLLVFARSSIGQLSLSTEVVEVREVVEKVTRGWSEQDLGRLTVTGEAAVWSDRLRLEQVMRNLLSNAIRHGGDQVEVRIVTEEPSVGVQVIDNGPGIPADLQRRMFDPYEHGETLSQPATIGLGLTVARELARHMAGDLIYEARPGESAFTLTLPAAQITAAAGHQTPESDDVPVTSRITPAQVTEVLAAGRLDIAFQPVVEIGQTGDSPTVVGLEALSRFPTGTPPEWFHTAASTGQRVELELLALRSAVRAFAPVPEPVWLSVNVSLATLTSPGLLDALADVIPGRVILELREAEILNHYQELGEELAALTDRGYRLAIDHMGTAHSDLWHLVRLRPAFVKLNMQAIRDLDLDAAARGLVHGLQWLAKSLPMRLIVQGVEREEELRRLRSLHVRLAQGHLFARPAELAHLPIEVQPPRRSIGSLQVG